MRLREVFTEGESLGRLAEGNKALLIIVVRVRKHRSERQRAESRAL